MQSILLYIWLNFRSKVEEHIESYHPQVAHYRRIHAPNRRYLPSDVTITSMHQDFNSKDPQSKCSYEHYRSTVREMNISFTKLGEEGCEVCEGFEMNKHAHGHIVNLQDLEQYVHDDNAEVADCALCNDFVKHTRAAIKSRKHYRADAEPPPQGTRVRSADLQKVIMLPRMPGIKTAIFTRRIIAFHETFAAVGERSKKDNKEDTISVVWHEGITGRNQEDLTSAFAKMMASDRDVSHMVIWLDNCAAQNKNWCLLSSLVLLLNTGTLDDLTLKFFEKGHTFMSADSVHHGVEREMANQPGGNIYDFDDFIKVVSQSNSGAMNVLQLRSEDVKSWRSYLSQAKVRKQGVKLADMVQIQLRRGCPELYYKVDHDQEEFIRLDFLIKAFTNVFTNANIPQPMRERDRGIAPAKKADIVQKLCPLMPANRRPFWKALVTSDVPEDLEQGM